MSRPFLCLLMSIAIGANSQNGMDDNPNFTKNFKVRVGLEGQWFFLDEKSPSYSALGIYNSIYVGDGGNSEGLGIVIEPTYKIPRTKFSLSYSAVVRYDVTIPRRYFLWTANDPLRPNVKGLFINHRISLYRSIFIPFKFVKRSPSIGVGYSFISSGLSYPFDWVIYDARTQTLRSGSRVDLSFNGLHVQVGIPILKYIIVEPKLIFMPEGQIMFRPGLSSKMINVSVMYQFSRKEKKKEI